MRIILILLLIVFNFSFSKNTIFEISSYDNVINITNLNISIKQGDDFNYTNIKYNDSNWHKIPLIYNWQKLFTNYIGICWYRFYIKFPDYLPTNSIGIQLGIISDVDQVYFNGVLIGQKGSFENKREHAYDLNRIYEIPAKCILTNQSNLISIRIKNHFPNVGGIYKGKVKIGPLLNLVIDFYRVEIIKLFFIIVYLSTSLYFLFFYINGAQGLEFLIFSILSFLVSVYFFMRNELRFLLFNDFTLMKKIEYIVLFSIIPLIFEFVRLFCKKYLRWYLYVFYLISLVCVLIVLFTNQPLVWNLILNRFLQYFWILGFIYVFYVIFSKFKEISEIRHIFYSLFIIFIAIINDLIYTQYNINFEFIDKYGYLTQYGAFFFMLSVSMILSNRFFRMNKEIQDLNKDLHRSYSKLKELDDLKDNFLCNVSHELKTPLTIIKGYFDLLKEELVECINKKVINNTEIYEYFQNITVHINHLISLINNLIEVSSIEAGKVIWENEFIDMNNLINNILDKKKDVFKSKNIEITLNIEKNLPLLKFDKKRISQVFENLIDNSCKFNATSIKVSVYKDKNNLKIIYEDKGPGIDMNKADYLFDKFHQYGDILTNKPKGLGLGLPLCKLIIEHYRGTIQLDKNYLDGVRFNIEFPLNYIV